MNNYYVYKHTNLINGKVYIGMSGQKTYNRWKAGNYINCPRFNAAIEEFGWNNFSHEILFDNLTKETAKRLEGLITVLLRSNDERFGYNMICGSTGKKGGDCGIGLAKINEERKKKVRCIETGEIFESIRAAAIAKGINYGNLAATLKGKHKTCGGYRWECVL